MFECVLYPSVYVTYTRNNINNQKSNLLAEENPISDLTYHKNISSLEYV